MLRNFTNFSLLVVGYGLGQGGLFVAQTWLVTHGELPRFAEFGLAFYMASLLVMLVDFGATQFLAREIAQITSSISSIWPHYWNMVPVRLGSAFIGILCLLVYGAHADHFTRSYLTFAAPTLVIWAFNATGLLDGLRLSGASGLTASLPFLTSSMALVATSRMPTPAAGAALGSSLTIGYATAVVIQFVILAAVRQPLRFNYPTRIGVREAALHGGAAMLSLLPGQLYFRIQLALCAVFLPKEVTALFLYAKQVVVGVAMLLGFLLRVNFPRLVKKMTLGAHYRFSLLLHEQRVAISMAALGSACAGGIGFAAHLHSGKLADAGLTVAIFSPVILTSGISLAAMQGLMATRMFRRAAFAAISSTGFATLVSATAVRALDVRGLALADVCGNLLSILAVALSFRQTSRAMSEKPCAY